MFKWAARPEIGRLGGLARTAGALPALARPGRTRPPRVRREILPHRVVSPLAEDLEAREFAGFATHVALHDPTEHLGTLHCHASELAPGAGYEAHADPYDVAIVLLEGEVETLGERVRPHGVILYAAGEPHGMRNPGDCPAHYLVFEFHRRETLARAAARTARAALRRGSAAVSTLRTRV